MYAVGEAAVAAVEAAVVAGSAVAAAAAAVVVVVVVVVVAGNVIRVFACTNATMQHGRHGRWAGERRTKVEYGHF